ncbi:CDP-alcohol phosphatidyltransferase family protein [Roseomonas marmotae]|uniref:Phosphatidylcholine/phosphatidylserine synthase n=1 Tax=Roseomonas marmotae TaxID=2768161 RepID=A0ABS3K822_9PROT|nr:phosphatidylcholine/phosphatidylserine synthase [Roseomonas marmotae]MBO1073599.1 phosphatidylcholine/phosphatidylserine synthase [Roseomonas marmotae]
MPDKPLEDIPGGGAGEPRRRFRFAPRRRPRFQGQSFNKLIPNIMTMLGLSAGLLAMRFALDGRWAPAAALIIGAAVIDGLDGRLARLLKATSRFGAEFDSLADFLSFGVAPAMVLYMWTMDSWRGIGFVPCVLFAVCMSLRLARFNAALDVGLTPKPAYAQSFFTGVPAPAGAGLVLFPMFLSLTFEGWGWHAMAQGVRHPAFVGLLLIVVALMLVSTLPTWSFKNFKVRREVVLPLLISVGAYAALLVGEPWAALAAAGLIYIGMLPFSVRSYLRLKREAEALREPVPAPESPASTP